MTVGTRGRTAGIGRRPIEWLARRSIRFSFLLVLGVVLATGVAAIFLGLTTKQAGGYSYRKASTVTG